MTTVLIFTGVILMALTSARLREHTPALLGDSPVAMTSGVAASVRGRLRLTLGIAAVGAIALIMYGMDNPGSFGLLLAIAPGTATAIALLGFIMYPSPRHAARLVRSANLVPRTPSRYLSRGAVAVPVAAAAGLLLFLVYAGVTASTDEAGLSRSIAREDELGRYTAGPYPGWHYGLPLIVLTGVLAGLTVVAVIRIAAAPAEPDARMGTFDIFWRQHTSQLIVRLSTVTLLAYTVGVLYFAGGATRRIATTINQSGEPIVHVETMTLGWMETISALILLVVAGWLFLGIVERLRSFALTTRGVK